MTVAQLYAFLNEKIPPSLSCEWDNDGLMCCPDPEKVVKKVLIALDITAAVVEKAVAEGYDVVLSHHPLVFRPLKSVQPANPVAKKVIRLLLSGISAMSFHTRLDAVEGGVNDVLAARLGLLDVVPFGNGEETIGRIGTLSSPMTATDFAKHLKAVTNADTVTLSDAGREVYRVALLGGSGADDVGAAAKAGADTYVTGELGHHYLTDAPEGSMNLLIAGHFHTEDPVCERLAELVKQADQSIDVTVTSSYALQVF